LESLVTNEKQQAHHEKNEINEKFNMNFYRASSPSFVDFVIFVVNELRVFHHQWKISR